MKRVLVPAMIAGSYFAAAPALAATATGTFNATMTITAECRVASTNTLAFGSAGVWTSPVTTSAALEVQCTNGTEYQIGLGFSANATGGTQRRMKHGTNAEYVNYDLFTDAGFTTAWGNTDDTDTLGHTTRNVGNGAAQSYTVYGRVPVQTVPTPGAYSDTVTVTVTY
jgi:spore coat protein U-like protein